MGNWYCDNMKDEVPYEHILEKAENGEFHKWNFEPFEFIENGYEGVIDQLRTFKATDYLDEKDPAKQEKMVDEVLAIYRKVDVFPIQYYSEMGITNEIEKCIGFNKAKFDGDTVSCGAGIGTTLCNYLFPNLFDVPSKHDLDKKGAETLYAKFHNDEYLRRAIKFCFSYKDGCPTPTNVMGGLRLVGSAPTNFRPMNAKAVYERFCPKGGVIYDYCCFDDETKFFNGKEWKYISEYVEGDKVLQYNEDGSAELVDPIEYIHYTSKDPFYESNSYVRSCQTGNHDVVYKLYNEDRTNMTTHKIKQEELVKMDKAGTLKDFQGYIPVAFRYDGPLELTDEDIAKFKDELMGSKIDHMSMSVLREKYAYLNSLSNKSRLKLINFLIDKNDGTIKCKNGNGMKLVEDLCEFAGCFLTWELKGGLNVAKCYEDQIPGNVASVRVHNVTGAKHTYARVHKDHKYCFVVPSHMLVVRRKGHTYISGNCGFGGRMLGALSSKNNYKYVGTDPNTETMYHLHQLGEYIEQATGREDSFELHCCGSEEFIGKPNSVDFSFSSPPYFDLEVYSQEETQCFNKFPKLEDWLEGYVRQTIKNIHYMLKPGRYYAVNIADFKVGGGTEVAYVDEWIRISTEEGMPLFDTVYLGVTARAGSKEQAAGELKKENILIFKKPM